MAHRLAWTPDVFWRSTLTEFFAAVDGWCQANGIRTNFEAPTRDRNEELKRLYG